MKDSSRTAGLILAKSRSSRLTNKNTRDFKGKPMFLHAVEKCLKIFDVVYVSSDSQEILDQAKHAGAKTILRSEELCGDTPNIPVYQHAFACMEGEYDIVAVQANSPTVPEQVIYLAKHLIEMGVDEVMTCHTDRQLYGSVWGISRKKLLDYGNPYAPEPSVLIVDNSVDIHTEEDLERALNQI
jgi:CMP-N-acetylneuraminic acid synthetase